MAYIKHLAIRSATHISNVVSYIKSESKTEEGLVTGVNCDYNKVKEEFEFAKILHNKTDCKIIAHQYIQSFKIGEVTPDVANEIGIKLVDKIAPGYQALVVTHTDKDHVHNHILINSVNIVSGYMYRANKDSLKFTRDTSDDILKEYNLSIIKEKSGLRGIDQATYQLALKGQSWKVKILNSIDEAIAFSNTKDGFIKYMNDLGYEVKWQNENISFRDPKEQVKFIRAKTLAKQFGEEYSKEGIENRLREIKEFESNRTRENIHEHDGSVTRNEGSSSGHISNSENDSRKDRNSKPSIKQNEYERYERWKRKNFSYYEKESSSLEHTFYNLGKAASILDINKGTGKNRDQAKEETFKILVFLASLAILSIKKSLKRTIESNRYRIKKVNLNKKIGNIDYMSLKNMPGENKFIKLELGELEKLSGLKFNYSGFVKDNSIIIMLKSDNFNTVLNHLGRIHECQYGNITYTALKTQNEKLEFRVVDTNMVQALQNSDIKFACFRKDVNKFNVAFGISDIEKYTIISKIVRNKSKDISR